MLYRKNPIAFILFIAFVFIYSVSSAAAESSREYRVKAVYLYKFLLFTEWPEEAFRQNDDKITIGILGAPDSFGDMFKEVEGKKIKERKLVIRRFGPESAVDSLKECQMLFISSLLRKNIDELIKSLAEQPVLTVSEIKGFVDNGGIINFLVKKDSVRFEINNGSARRVGIKFSSKLLRLAEKVVEDSDNDEK